jgi:PTH1 family peptidyl-tRNA hydrolase
VLFGLGNPGAEYAETRHNAGFLLVDLLAQRWELPPFRPSGNAWLTGGEGRHHVVLVKPQTWMNLSGEALAPFLALPQFVPSNDLLVISDDFAIPLGTFRLRASGSSGGHHGLDSIASVVGSEEYPRLRVGIGPLPQGNTARDFVLARWSPQEWDQLEEGIPAMLEAVECWVESGIETAMNRFNQRTSSR